MLSRKDTLFTVSVSDHLGAIVARNNMSAEGLLREAFGSYLGFELYYFLQGKRAVLKEEVYTNAINKPCLLSIYELNKPFRILVNSYFEL